MGYPFQDLMPNDALSLFLYSFRLAYLPPRGSQLTDIAPATPLTPPLLLNHRPMATSVQRLVTTSAETVYFMLGAQLTRGALARPRVGGPLHEGGMGDDCSSWEVVDSGRPEMLGRVKEDGEDYGTQLAC